MASIGEQIQSARKAKGLTQEALAKAVNVTRQSISNYESGKRLPDVETLKLLARELEFNFMMDSDDIESGSDTSGAVDGTSAEGTSVPENNMADRVIGEEAQEVEQNNAASANDGLPAKHRPLAQPSKWLIPTAAILVLAIVLAIWQPWKGTNVYPSDDGSTYTKAEFQLKAENDATKAYLRLVPSVELTEGDTYDYWLYTLTAYEQNSIAVSIDRVEEFIFGAKTVVHRTYGATDMQTAGLSVEIPANGEWAFIGGFPVQKISGVGFKVTGTDENGAVGTFTCFLPLSEK